MRAACISVIALLACMGCPQQPADKPKVGAPVPPGQAATQNPKAERSAAESERLQRIPVGDRAFPKELEPVRAKLESSRLEYVAITPRRQRDTKPWESKFLGLPYLPRAMAWPRGADGRPLAFLAQVNFAEIPRLADYPERGIVQFFIAGAESSGRDGHVWGMNFDGEKPFDAQKFFAGLQRQAHFRVLFHADPVEDASRLHDAPPSGRTGHLPISTAARLEFHRTFGYALPSDYRFERIFGKEPSAAFSDWASHPEVAGQAYLDFVASHHTGRIGGYATFTQHDPRSIRPDEDWIVLLGIDSSSENGVDILWGDAGVGYFLIRRADLKARDFSKVAYNWDNH